MAKAIILLAMPIAVSACMIQNDKPEAAACPDVWRYFETLDSETISLNASACPGARDLPADASQLALLTQKAEDRVRFIIRAIRRSHFAKDDTGTRRVGLQLQNDLTTADFAKIECQIGNSSKTCEISEDQREIWLTFAPEEWQETISWRLLHLDGRSRVYKTTPAELTPWLKDPASFTTYTCDTQATQDMSFTEFTKLIEQTIKDGYQTLCLGDGRNPLAITNNGDEPALSLAAVKGLKIIARFGSKVEVINQRTTGPTDQRHALRVSGGEGLVISGLNFVTYGQFASGIVLNDFGSKATLDGITIATYGDHAPGLNIDSYDSLTVSNSSIVTKSFDSHAIRLSKSQDYQVRSSLLKTAGDRSHAFLIEGAKTFGSVTDSIAKTLGKQSHAMHIYDASGKTGRSPAAASVIRSTLIVNQDDRATQTQAVLVFDASAKFQETLFAVGGDGEAYGLTLGDPQKPRHGGNSSVYVELEDNLFVKLATESETSSSAILVVRGETIAPELRSVKIGTTTPSTNSYCNMDGKSEVTFNRIIDNKHGATTAWSYFTADTENSGQPIGECDADTIRRLGMIMQL